MKVLHFFLVLALAISLTTQAYADLTFFKDRCLDPFSSQAYELPIDDLNEVNRQGAIFYQNSKTSAVLSGNLEQDWLRTCSVGWSVQEETSTIITQWQSDMRHLGMTTPPECVKTVAGNIRVFAASEQMNAQGLYILGQLEITGGKTKAWAQISEQDGPYPLRLECAGDF